MAVHIGESGDELLVIDRGRIPATEFGRTHETHAGFHTHLPEERNLLQFHTEEQGHLYESANETVGETREVIVVGHGGRIRCHAVCQAVETIRGIGDTHVGVVAAELSTHGHEELLVAQLITQTEATTYEAAIVILEAYRISTAHGRGITDAGGKEVGIAKLAPETESVRDVAIVVSFGTSVGLVDSLHLAHVSSLLLRSRELRLVVLSLLLSTAGCLTLLLTLTLRIRLLLLRCELLALTLLLGLGLVALFLRLGFGFLAFFLLLSLRFLAFALLFCFRLGIDGINSRNAVIHEGCHRRQRRKAHSQQEYVDNAFHLC